MNPRSVSLYGIQSVFAVLQSALIVAGSMSTAAIMKARGFPDPNQFWHPHALFVREWGFLLIVIPGAWVVATIWLEDHPRVDFSRRWTLVTGSLTLGGIAWLMLRVFALGSGAGTTLQVIE